jgi:Tol biopolymer transport system component
MIVRQISIVALMCCLSVAAWSQSVGQSSTPSATKSQDVAAAVARMARVGSAVSPRFSPDGKWVSFISNISGAPQVWIVTSEGGYPRMVTNGDDPVTQQEWSPANDWIAGTIATGGGLNTQVYIGKPDGTGIVTDATASRSATE